MRKPLLFALGMCAAALLGQVSLTLAEQVQSSAAQTSGQQSAPPQSQQTVKQASAQKTQSASPSEQTGKQPSAQKAQATPSSPQTEKQSAARQSQQTGKQPSSQKTQAGPPSPQTAKQASGQKTQVTPPTAQTAKPTPAQNAQAARPPVIPAGYRLLGLKEGRAIVQGMSWTDDEEGLAPDCSHLVHKLYEQAGYSYPYASSLDLYRGTGLFLRVRYAHPGDLVVWRGHVGIVVNPQAHSFFSTTSSGTRIQSYSSAYWRTRGYPRFLRYLTNSPVRGGASEASNRPPALQPTASKSPASQPPASKPKDPPQH